MANYATLKAAIQNVVKTNGNNEITGALLQQSLLAMVDSLGAFYQFVGIAQPSTNPGTPDQKCFYLAFQPGTYVNFNGAVISGGQIGIFTYVTFWTVNVIDIVTLVNDLKTGGVDKALTAEMGKILNEKISKTSVIVETNTYTNENYTGTAGSYWINNNGKLGYASSGAGLSRSDAIPVYPGAVVNLICNIGGAYTNIAYVCDENDNILQTIPRTGATTETTFTVVENGTKMYVNYITFSATVNGKFDKKIEDLEGALTENENRLIQVEGVTVGPYPDLSFVNGKWGESSGNAIVNTAGSLWRAYKCPVSFGHILSLYTRVVASDSVVGYFADENNKIVSSILNNGDSFRVNTEIVPFGAKYLLFNLYNLDATCKVIIEPVLSPIEKQFFPRKTVNIAEHLALSESDFAKGSYIGANNLFIVRSTAIVTPKKTECVPGVSISYSIKNNFRLGFAFYRGETFRFVSSFFTGTGTFTPAEIYRDCDNFRIYVIEPSGTSIVPTWDNIGLEISLNPSYQYLRAAAEISKENYESYELPIIGPNPQKPANDTSDSDFNAETLKPAELYLAFDELFDSMQQPSANDRNNPKVCTQYSKIGRDATNTFDIKAYVLGNRNRFAWKFADALFAWKNGNSIVYTDSISPLIGQILYSDALRTDSGKTVTSSNVTYITGSDNITYSRSKTDDIAADVFFTTRAQGKGTYTSMSALDKNGNSLGTATPSGGNAMVLNSKTYERCEDFDYHTQQRGTIFLWGNEHGPQSDPAECAIILYRLAVDLCNGCCNNPFISWLKQNFMVVMIPCANPWGLENHSRNNANNVNINRNYATPGWSVVSDTDKGNYAGDQPETQFIMNTCYAFGPSVAIDIHCLGYVSAGNEGKTHYEGQILATNMLQKAINVMFGLSFSLSSYGIADPNTKSQGADWINYQNFVGGLIEMNAGPYANPGNGKQHSSHIMTADYTLLLLLIRVWLQEFDPDIDLTQLHLM